MFDKDETFQVRDRFIAVEYQLVFVEFASCISCSQFSLAIVNTDCLPTFENEFYINFETYLN